MTHDYFHNTLTFWKIFQYPSILTFQSLHFSTSWQIKNFPYFIDDAFLDCSNIYPMINQYFSFYYKVIWLSRDHLDIPMWPDCQTFLNLEIFRKKQRTNNFFSIHSQISNCTSTMVYLLIIPTEKQDFPDISIRYFNFCLSFFQNVDHISPIKYYYSTKKLQRPANQCFQLKLL